MPAPKTRKKNTWGKRPLEGTPLKRLNKPLPLNGAKNPACRSVYSGERRQRSFQRDVLFSSLHTNAVCHSCLGLLTTEINKCFIRTLRSISWVASRISSFKSVYTNVYFFLSFLTCYLFLSYRIKPLDTLSMLWFIYMFLIRELKKKRIDTNQYNDTEVLKSTCCF